MFRFKTSHLLLMVGLIAPIPSYAANFCIKVNGGFGSGGSSFVGKGFALPTAGNCKPWAGYVKTAPPSLPIRRVPDAFPAMAKC